ncbi:MAG: hypothetical protein U0271_00245 [Polyangiaceae bacterium]
MNEPSKPPQGDWESSMAAFQSVETGLDWNAARLAEAVARGRRKLVRGWVIGVAVALTTSFLGIRALVRDPSVASAVFAGMQVLVPAWILAFVYKSQRGTWAPAAETTRAFLRLEIARREDWIRRMRFLRFRITPALFALTVTWHALLLSHRPELVAALPTFAGIVGFGGAYLIGLGVFLYAGRRERLSRLERGELEARSRELDEADYAVSKSEALR